MFEIKNKINSKSHKIYIIAEAGLGHFGSFENAKKLVLLAKNSGADAVKFQAYITEDLIHSKFKKWFSRYKTKEVAAGISAGNESTSFAINLAGINTDAFSAFVPDDSKASNTQNIDKDGNLVGVNNTIDSKFNEKTTSDEIRHELFETDNVRTRDDQLRKLNKDKFKKESITSCFLSG